MLTVIHRGDHLIEENAARGYADHAAILDFLERELVGKKFPHVVAVHTAMARWPAFMEGDSRLEGQRGSLDEMIFTHDGCIGLGPGAHGPLDVAVVVEAE